MIRQKMDSLSFELLRFFISKAGLGTGTSCACVMSISSVVLSSVSRFPPCQRFKTGLDKLRASEPASHASRASESCESSCEPCETDVSSQSIFLSSAFGGFRLFGTSFRYPRSPFNIVLLSAFIFF